MADSNLFDKLRIGIASPEDIRKWSHGEVRKPETINYRTFKPERDGLFCEKIFGPTKDYECACGRYKKIKYKGVICDKCGVEVTRSKVRRERMGHIELAAPVCHIWYLKGVPSPLALILNISPRQLEKVIYFASFIIIDLEAEKIRELMPEILGHIEQEKIAIQNQMQQLELESLKRLTTEMVNNPDEYFDEGYVRERLKANYDRIRAEYRDADDRLQDLDIAGEMLGMLEENQLIDEDKWRAISKMLDAVGRRMKKDLGSLVHASIGADAAKELLRRVDIEQLVKDLRTEIRETTSAKRLRAIKRLELTEALLQSKCRPEWMVLESVPVISPELRPMVQLDGGRFATSDLNDLYRRIINRNNRLKKIIDIQAPESIINHEKRLLQESVDALIDNGRRARPVVGSNQRQLKSLSDMLKGKEGRFRKNLLGKRVDYSGRSVIVVGPHLKLHQCGLPKEMALELFKPFVMKILVEDDKSKTKNIKTAKKMIERMHPEVWDALEKVIKEHPVLLNRAPTLHRLGIQAFEPILVEGKAIQLHPLVCHAYNADFDGDQMAVHVPLSLQAQAEARCLMLSTQNLFSPADGKPVMSPVQDPVLGLYALTFTRKAQAEQFRKLVSDYEKDPQKNPAPLTFGSPEEVEYHLESPTGMKLGLNDLIRVRIQRPVFKPASEVDYRDPMTGIEYKEVITENDLDQKVRELVPLDQEFESIYAITTPGRLQFNDVLPYPMRYSQKYLDREMTNKTIADSIIECYNAVGAEGAIRYLDDIKELGFKWATRYGISVALTDMDPPAQREEILSDADHKADSILSNYRMGGFTFKEMQKALTELWSKTYDDMGKAIQQGMQQMNPLSIITVSGARGSIKQLSQLSGMRGLMFNQFNETIYELPVRNSFQKGLNMLEYFATTHGARKGLADTALRTADAGYLTRRLVDVAQDVIVRSEDCGTQDGILAFRLEPEGKVIETMGERAFSRFLIADIKDPESGEIAIPGDTIIGVAEAALLTKLEQDYFNELETAGENEKKAQKVIDKFVAAGFEMDDHGRLGAKVRSAITCELDQGICAKCYGIDLASKKVVENGVAVGIIAAQSIGEPGTQLTMRTFHTGGVAGSKVIAKTNQFKTGKFIRLFQEDFQSATKTSAADFDPTKLLESQESVVMGLFSNTDEAKKRKQKVRSRRTEKSLQKAEEKMQSDSRKMWERNRKTFFYTWTGESSGIVRVEEIFEARKQPRGKAIICSVTGTVADVQTFSFGRLIVIEAEVDTSAPVKEAYITDDQDWDITKHSSVERLVGQKLTTAAVQTLRKYEIEKVKVLVPVHVPPQGDLPVEKGQRVIKGDPLTQGPLDPHEVLELAGAKSVHEYFVENLQSVYKDQGVDIHDKHLEVIVRQMLRKRQIRENGDTTFLPGQIVDRGRLRRENERVQKLIDEGKKIKFTDAEGNQKERDPKLATANWVLLGITEASLATESFLSAASFQKTTRVLTEAAVRGKSDTLLGLKENVIIGRLIPAGTGVKAHRELAIEIDNTQPGWSNQPLNILADADDSIDELEVDEFGGMSIAELAAEEAEAAGDTDNKSAVIEQSPDSEAKVTE